MHPLAIALSVITGTILAGIVGALLAVPFVAFLNSTVHALRHTPAGATPFPIRDGTTEDEPVEAAEPAEPSSDV